MSGSRLRLVVTSPYEGGDLRQVIAIGRAVACAGGGRITFLSAEVWGSGLVIHFAETLPPFERPNPGGQLGWTLQDSAGTPYFAVGGHRGGKDTELAVGSQEFVPAPPAEVTKLLIVGPRMRAEDAVEIALTRPH